MPSPFPGMNRYLEATDIWPDRHDRLDSGPYARGAVDYDVAPAPPVSPERREWLTSCLQRWKT